jgi:glycosyltransferase involved in cell wall biosynthesis
MVAIPRGSLLKEPLDKIGVTVYEVDGLADRSFHKDDVKTLRALIKQVKPDLVHTHGALSGRIAARFSGVPVIYSRHSAFPVPAKIKYPPGRWVNKLVNEFFADHIIAVSPATKENLTDGGISEKKITVVMNGVAPVEETAPDERKALKAELGIPEDACVFGILARIEDYKGHLYLVSAARELKERGYTNFRILIAGTGNFEQDVREAVVLSGVSDVVQMLGFRSDVAQLLNVLDCQLNASYGTEATSLALLEGMSLGLPSVVSDYGGNPWLVKHGDNGLVFPTRNSEELANCMQRLMEEPELARTMGQRAGEVFQACFTGEVFAENTQQVYRMILKGVKE